MPRNLSERKLPERGFAFVSRDFEVLAEDLKESNRWDGVRYFETYLHDDCQEKFIVQRRADVKDPQELINEAALRLCNELFFWPSPLTGLP